MKRPLKGRRPLPKNLLITLTNGRNASTANLHSYVKRAEGRPTEVQVVDTLPSITGLSRGCRFESYCALKSNTVL